MSIDKEIEALASVVDGKKTRLALLVRRLMDERAKALSLLISCRNHEPFISDQMQGDIRVFLKEAGHE